ncbi:MAG: N-acetylmuramoyl-L-alanine amidase [Oscillospiraceae bacterium]|nr:N-acetylmuramoyl-L-alanine amidase [Oscillospiraceae bacterium]
MNKKMQTIIFAAVFFIVICTAVIGFRLYGTAVLGGIKNVVHNIPAIHSAEPTVTEPPVQTQAPAESDIPDVPEYTPAPSPKYDPPKTASKIIVLDPGHGKSSGQMSSDEKKANGWQYNESRESWGEWRHWRSGSLWNDCKGSNCTGRAPANGSCWYPIGKSDRDTEPGINLDNTLAAKKYLEEMGYTVRVTRTDNKTNPSMTQRLKYCYSDMDTTRDPDADLFVCIHSNAGGGSGSCYIALSGEYDQAGISDTYIKDGNTLGKYINDEIVNTTSLSAYSGGRYDGYPELVLFCKSPVTIAYLEIGFFDNSKDLNILRNESDRIGMAIAKGIDKYVGDYGI